MAVNCELRHSASAEQEGPVRTELEYTECTFYVGFHVEYSIHIKFC